MKNDIVGLLIIEQTGVSSLGGTARCISDVLTGVQEAIIKESQKSIAGGGWLKFQVFELVSSDVLFEVTIDFKKPFHEIIRFQPPELS